MPIQYLICVNIRLVQRCGGAPERNMKLWARCSLPQESVDRRVCRKEGVFEVLEDGAGCGWYGKSQASRTLAASCLSEIASRAITWEAWRCYRLVPCVLYVSPWLFVDAERDGFIQFRLKIIWDSENECCSLWHIILTVHSSDHISVYCIIYFIIILWPFYKLVSCTYNEDGMRCIYCRVVWSLLLLSDPCSLVSCDMLQLLVWHSQTQYD